ncbi:hypothetical protein HR45_02995 [Shewanella mangrovi]|uniref:Uncharacterized protein n=1 Tax=Shewanella mangrovi TaxID=1515746 RepID=A0A094JGV2_9GAMM|nr:hypothetical protein [Shewanella mangrovi]KFZ38427.1 hypothetical protein HR45_02995 [Shewanella mangrovi]
MSLSIVNSGNIAQQNKPKIHIENPEDSLPALLIQLLKHVDVSFGAVPIDLINLTLGTCQEIGLVLTTELDNKQSSYLSRTLSTLSHDQFLQSVALEAVLNVPVRQA